MNVPNIVKIKKKMQEGRKGGSTSSNNFFRFNYFKQAYEKNQANFK